MSATYRAAIIGCGGMGGVHARAYKQAERVELLAAADPLEAARDQFQQDVGVPQVFASTEEMLAAVQPDIVSVCTWHPLHPAATVAAARAGAKGIICEKPMAISLGEADRMLAACSEHGTRLAIGHQRRFTRGWERGRALVQGGAIGEPLFVNARIAEGLLNWGTHTIDGVRFALNDPDAEWVMGAVERNTDRHERDTLIEDACMGLVNFAGGVQAFIESDLRRDSATAGAFRLRGTAGMLEVAESQVRLFNAHTRGWHDVPLGRDAEAYPAIGGQTNVAQVQELLAWIEGGPEHRGAGRRARATVEIMMALYQSAREHRMMRLPLEERDNPLELMVAEGKLPVRDPGRYDIRDPQLRAKRRAQQRAQRS
ncbi:MAG: hypothetical protein CL878_10620 [Dehalococcoidia bacterium]|nr:hypothetical protein [Dehalococcoidia bacterium]